MKNSHKYLLISTITFITGYLFFRFGYAKTSSTPFAQEILLLVFGTIATLAITAALLNKQSDVELEKEQRVKVFDIKSDLYFELINFIEKLIRQKEINKTDLITLEFLTHKISIIASAEVLQEYTTFVECVKKTSLDSKISPTESSVLSEKLARLCYQIRYDLIIKKPNSTIDTKSIIYNNFKNV